MIYPPKGDAFAERNKYAMEIDFEEQPPMFKISDTHSAATWLLHPNAPKIDPPKAITDRIARMKKAADEAEKLTAENNDLQQTAKAMPNSVDAKADDGEGISEQETTARTMGGDIADEAKNAGALPDIERAAAADGTIKKSAVRKPAAKSTTAKKTTAAKSTAAKSTTAKKTTSAKTTTAKKTTAAKSTAAKKPAGATAKKPTAKKPEAKSDKE